MNAASAIRAVIASIVISAVAVVFLTGTQGKSFDLVGFYQSLKPSAFGLVLVAISLIGWWVIGGIRIKIIADSLPREPDTQPITLGRASRAMLLSLFTAAITPSVGAALGLVWYLSRYLGAQAATAITLYSLVTDLVYYAWSLPVSYLVLTLTGVNLNLPVIGPALGVFAIAASALMLFFAFGLTFRPHALSKLVWNITGIGFLKRFRKSAYRFVRETAETLEKISHLSPGKQLLLHFVTALSYISHFLAFNVLLWACGFENVKHVTILAAQSLLVALSLIVPSPGGAGYFELVLPSVLEASGLPRAAEIPLALIWRVLSYYLYIVIGLFIGGAALMASNKRNVEKPDRQP
jgi:glycosyltransferase 2 family protein